MDPLYQHQQDDLVRMATCDGFMLANDAGTGKTRTMIEDAWRYAEPLSIRPAIVVVAPNGVHDEVWPYEIARFWRDDVPYRLHVYHSGEGKRVTAARMALATDTPMGTVPILVVHTDSTSHASGCEAISVFCAQARTRRRPVLFLIDEIHLFKTPGSQRTRKFTKLVHDYASRVRGASGTLVGKGHEDLFATYRLLSPTLFGKTYIGFKTQYCIEQTMGGRFTKIVGYRNIDALYEKIAPITSRRIRDECLDLPERTFITRHVDLSVEQTRVQADLVRQYTAELREQRVTATEATTRLLRLAQVANGYVIADDGAMLTMATEKPDALVQVLDEYADPKVVVWCRFRPDVNNVLRALERAGITAIRHDGTMTKEQRADALVQWRVPEGPRVMVATMKTLGIGRTLNEATLAVLYSLDFDRILYHQTLARNYRAGQRERVVVVTLSARNSADLTIEKNLERKEAMQAPLDDLAMLASVLTDLSGDATP